jgi:hypothetical protein
VPEGSFSYKWSLTNTIDGDSATTATISLQKGLSQDVNYRLTTLREVDSSNQQLTVTGALTIANGNAAAGGDIIVTAIALQTVPTAGAGAAASVTHSCTALPVTLTPASGPGPSFVKCTFTKAVFNGYPEGTVQATIIYADNSTATQTLAPPDPAAVSPTFNYNAITGQFASALLTNKFDLAPIDTLYSGFSGFSRESVWRTNDEATRIPAAGVLITTDTTEKT